MDAPSPRGGEAAAAADPHAHATEPLDFRALLGAAPDLYLVLRADAPRFTIVAVSDAYLRATLTTREGPSGIIGRTLFEVFPDPPGDPAATGERNLRASLERAIATGTPDAMAIQPYAIQRPDGSWEERSWSPLNTPVVDAATGQVTLLIHRVVDVTDSLRLAAAHVRLRTEHTDLEAFSRALEDANAQLQEQQLELELANQQLQDQATELELQAEELEERTRAAEQAAEALAESEMRHRLAVDAARLGTWTWDLATDAATFDDRARELFGLGSDGMQPRLSILSERIHPDDRERVAAALAAANDPRGDGRYAAEYRIVRPDGTERWASTDGVMRFDGEGAARRAASLIGTVMDITERKHAETARLRERAAVADARRRDPDARVDGAARRLHRLVQRAVVRVHGHDAG